MAAGFFAKLRSIISKIGKGVGNVGRFIQEKVLPIAKPWIKQGSQFLQKSGNKTLQKIGRGIEKGTDWTEKGLKYLNPIAERLEHL